MILVNLYFYSSFCYFSCQNSFKLSALFIMISWLMQCNLCPLVKAFRNACEIFILVGYLLVSPACNFTQIWTPSQIIYKVYDRKSRELFCPTHFSGIFWLVQKIFVKKRTFRSPQMEIEMQNIRYRIARLTFAKWRSSFNKVQKLFKL